MLKVAFKDLMARKRRLITTGIAVILGIAFLTGTQVLGGVLNDSIDGLFGDIYSGYDAVVRSPEVQETDFGEFRPPLEAAVVEQVRTAEGVRAAYGVVEAATVSLVGADGKVTGSGFGPPTLVYNWIDDPIRPGVLTEGRGPEAPDELALDFKTAADAELEVGDTAEIVGQDETREFELVGLVGFGDEGTDIPGAKPVYFVDEVAQELAGAPGQYNYVAAGAEEGVTQEELASAVADVVPDQQVITGEEWIEQNADQLAQFVGILTTVVTVFGVIALVVASFIIYNTFSIIVAQRTKETALLRAIGAGRRQVVVATLAEAALVGVIASLLGLVGGTLLATAIKALIGSTFTVTGGIAWPTGSTLLLAFGVGIVVTSLSAVIPSIRASRVPPVAAMTEVAVDHTDLSIQRKVWGSLFLVAGIVCSALGLTSAVGNELVFVGVGLLCIMLSVAVILGPLLAGPASRALAWPLTARGSMTARLASENAARNPRRTAATAAALTIGVTLVVVIAVLATSIKSSVVEEVDGALGEVDLIVSAGQFSFLGVPPVVSEEAGQIDGITEVSPVKFGFLRLLDEYGIQQAKQDAASDPPDEDAASAGAIFGVGDDAPLGEDAIANGYEPSNFFDLVDLGDVVGDPQASPGAAIAARDEIAEERGWEVGDTIPVYFSATGEQDLTLVATYSDGLGPDDDFYLSNETLSTNAPPGFDIDFAVYIATEDDPGVRAAAQAELEQLTADRPDVVVQDRREFVESQTAFIDVFVAVIYGLLALAVIIALIGIANTLSLSVLERTREFGLLRAVGMSKRQLRWTVRTEAAIVAVFGTLLGMVVGIAFAVALAYAITADDPGLLQLRLPVVQLVVIMVLAALAGIFAAILPARRAARLDVLQAIATE
ncbi:MAG: FtsX-like permease family protein [Microthrixaceae bacterium]|nr:FtsX-like permease family protein [Microthrixaceae bacterium]